MLPPGNGVPVTLPFTLGAKDWARHNDAFDGFADHATVAECFAEDGSKDDQLIFLQLPAQLPLNVPGAGGARREGMPVEVSAQTPRTAAVSSRYSGEEPPYFQQGIASALAGGQEGKIGKLRLHASGRATMTIAGVPFDVTSGVPVRFRQEAAAVELRGEEGGGDTFVPLGEIRRRLVCAPDIGALLRRDAEARRRSGGVAST